MSEVNPAPMTKRERLLLLRKTVRLQILHFAVKRWKMEKTMDHSLWYGKPLDEQEKLQNIYNDALNQNKASIIELDRLIRAEP
jgi:hypothetical protein